MKFTRIFAAIAVLAFAWGGSFCFAPQPVFAANRAQLGRQVQTLPGDYLTELAAGGVEKELTAAGETRRHTFAVRFTPAPFKLPLGPVICEVHLPRGIDYKGLTPVRVAAYVHDKLAQSTVIYATVRIYDTALVATHSLRPSQKLTASDLKLAEVAVDAADTRYLKDFSEIDGRVPTRALQEGQPLTENLLQPPYVIAANDLVTIRSNVNGIVASTEGIALGRGRVGDRIRVRNTRSKRVLMGTVVDAHTVEVG